MTEKQLETMRNPLRTLLCRSMKRKGTWLKNFFHTSLSFANLHTGPHIILIYSYRYYVDPSTIRHSLGSTASTSSSISQQSDGFNLIPLASSINSANITSKGSDMIGTTLQLQLNSKKQNNIITHALPASSRYKNH